MRFSMFETIRKPAYAPPYSARTYAKLFLPRCAAAVVLAPMIYAQSDLGSITGFVKDPSGAIVAKAQVMVRNEGTANRE